MSENLIGWISIHRKILKSWIYKNDKYFKAFLFLLLNANHKKKKIFKYNQLVEIDRGQIVISLNDLSNETSLSIQEARTFIRLLESDKVINKQTTNKLTKLTFINFERYQTKQQRDQQQKNKEINTEATDLYNNNNDDNDNNNKKIKEVAFFDRSSFILPLFFDEDIKILFYQYIEMRKKIKKPMIDGTIQRQINKLDKLSNGDHSTAIEILNYSTDRSYQDLFEPKPKLEFEKGNEEDYINGRDIFVDK